MKYGNTQLLLDEMLSLPRDAYAYGDRNSGEQHGVVLTKPHVVELILNLAGYLPRNDLAGRILVEPSCGHGAFVDQAVGRLCAARERYDRRWEDLGCAIRGFDIDAGHVQLTRDVAVRRLMANGALESTARKLANGWIREGDFLLTPVAADADYVVGNPPYIRIEQLAPELQAVYRRKFKTLYDRADLYVAFIEHGLDLLSRNGTLAFICADRWTLNRYGKRLRAMISASYQVNAYIDLHQASPFESDVIAYPSIFSLSRKSRQRAVRVTKLTSATADECRGADRQLRARQANSSVHVYENWFAGDEPWVLASPAHLKLLRELEASFPAIEDYSGTRVRIGVATGNDRVFIVGSDEEIEPDRLVPLVMRTDIRAGTIHDASRCVVNTFEQYGGPVDLRRYPKLARYLQEHAATIKGRHVAKKNPRSWFRTIDRVYPELVPRPKLLIPDIAGSLQVAFDPGNYYPHHNLYYVVTDEYDPEVLGALLSSRVAMFFVASYAVRMRGGYLRFQAQYLRRIRVPEVAALNERLASRLRAAFQARDFERIDSLALEAYGLRELPEFDFVDTRS